MPGIKTRSYYTFFTDDNPTKSKIFTDKIFLQDFLPNQKSIWSLCLGSRIKSCKLTVNIKIICSVPAPSKTKIFYDFRG